MKSEGALRVCFIEMSSWMSLTRTIGDPSKEQFFTSPVSSAAARFINELFATLMKGQNVSLQLEEEHSKCYDSLKHNQSDFLLQFADYQDVPFDQIYPIYVVKDMKIAFASLYNMTSPDSMKYADIMMSAFNALDKYTYFLVTVSLIVQCLLLNATNWMRRSLQRRKGPLRFRYSFAIVSHFLQKVFFEFNSAARRITSSNVTILSFFIFFFISSFVATDLIVFDDPKLISTFDDIINNKDITVMYTTALNTGDMIKDASNNTKIAKLRQAIKDRTYVMSGFSMTMEQALLLEQPAMSGKRVVVWPDISMSISTDILCYLMSAIKELKMKGFEAYPYPKTDPDSEGVQWASVMTQIVRQTRKGHILEKTVKRFNEGGIPQYLMNNIDFKGMIPVQPNFDYYRKCISHRIVRPDVPVTQVVAPVNLASLFKGFAIAIVLASLVVLFEQGYFRLLQSFRKNN